MINQEYLDLEKKIISKNNRFNLSKSDKFELKKNFFNSNILITGAAGSIGSAFVKLLKSYKFKNLILLDKDENQLTELNRDLVIKFSNKINKVKFICVDLNIFKIKTFLIREKISHYFNFAAIKHVRSQEQVDSLKYMFSTNSINFLPFQKINNSHLKQIFSISTDKSVYPTSMLGVSKLLMEQVLANFKKKNKKIHVSTTRFANVSFSNGSILKSIIDRINSKKIFGIPANILRYFITHEEAASICFKCLLKKNDNYILVPNNKVIGEPILVETLCRKILKIKGFKIEICSKPKPIKKNIYPVVINKKLTHGQKHTEKFNYKSEVLIDDFSDKTIKKIKIYNFFNQFQILSKIVKLENLNKIIKIIEKKIPVFSHNKKVSFLSKKI